MQTDDKLIIKGLLNPAMKPYKSLGKFLARITNTRVIVRESYAVHHIKVLVP
jgi:hypothetical protein